MLSPALSPCGVRIRHARQATGSAGDGAKDRTSGR